MNKITRLLLSLSLTASLVLPSSALAAENGSNPRKNSQFIFENEFGNSCKQATPVQMYSNVTGHIDRLPTDQDFYSLNLHESHKISFMLQSLANEVIPNLRLEIFDQDMLLIQKSELLYEYPFFEKQQINVSLVRDTIISKFIATRFQVLSISHTI
ncbi:hypothetical protein [Paenibacillus bouchesdurhonensis]|uniref:hypothetical protein n=1 Tax=Paenibacillus bouchesdurhonensis TaxID=1870990 RepID=UPI000DA63C72|nr:hypothetical protein [Paenibacillus bouchesdurhonensis]